MTKRGWVWIVAGVLAVAAALVWNARRGAHHGTHARELPPVQAETVTVRRIPMESFSVSEGTVRPFQEATLSPKIMSSVAAVLVREGDRVRRGQELVRLEAADLQAGVEQAGAALDAASASAQAASSAARMEQEAAEADIRSASAAVREARAHLQMVQTGPRRQERAQANIAVEQAKAQYELAHSEAERMRALFRQDVVSKQRLEQAEAAEAVAKAALDSARQQADLVAEGSRAEELKAARERLAQAEARLSAARSRRLAAEMRRREAVAAAGQARQARAGLTGAKTMASYSVIRAPFDGVVVQRLVDPGDQVGPGSPVLVLEDRSRWQIEAFVPETEAAALRPGGRALVRIDSLGADEREARIAEVRPGGDPSTRTVRVKADILDTSRLASGLFGRLLVPRGVRSVVAVPESAIMDREGLARVWVVGKDGRAELRVVTPGETRDGMTAILSGLKDGEKVAIGNLDAIQEGVQVREAAR
jgi:RND family efflux transporter MFP subunit